MHSPRSLSLPTPLASGQPEEAWTVRFGLVLAVLLSVVACGPLDDPLLAFEQGEYERSYHLWLPRAEAGEAEAQNYLGIQHYLGLGRRRNLEEARKWFARAAEQGHPSAQTNLGSMYRAGHAVEQDFYKAFVWSFAAAQQGNQRAKRQVDDLSGGNKLSPNQQLFAMLEANAFIPDPALRFTSRDYYIKRIHKHWAP